MSSGFNSSLLNFFFLNLLNLSLSLTLSLSLSRCLSLSLSLSCSLSLSPSLSLFRLSFPCITKNRTDCHFSLSKTFHPRYQVSSSYFQTVWRLEKRGCVKCVLRKWLRFAKCDDCVRLRTELQKARTVLTRTSILKEWDVHHRFIKIERRGIITVQTLTIKTLTLNPKP
jgi:hypothetical protein